MPWSTRVAYAYDRGFGAIAGLMAHSWCGFQPSSIEMGLSTASTVSTLQAAAYWLLPLWLLMEVFMGQCSAISGVCPLGATSAIRFWRLIEWEYAPRGLEQMRRKESTEKITWVSIPACASE